MPVNQHILKDVNSENELQEKGYVVIPFLNNVEVESLVDFYEENKNTTAEGLIASAHSPDLEYRSKLNDFIKQQFERANNANFESYQSLGGTYMVKTPGAKGRLYPHQDWNIVDEEEWRSFNVWVPLVDVNEQNGSIQVLDGSHLMGKTYRGINIESAFKNDYEGYWLKMKTLSMKAGEALVYDHRLLHASEENKGMGDRLVVVYGIIPEGAGMRYYYRNEDVIEEYECFPDFFLKGNPAAGPIGLKKIRDIKDGIVYFVDQKISEVQKEEKKSFWRRWFG